MQFVVLAYDGTDESAGERRAAARDAHLATIAEYKARGNIVLGAALTDDEGKMIGSVIVADFASRTELDHWLHNDPYTAGKVWHNVTVTPCKVAPSFQHLLAKTA